ncbi:uncharacterized protein LOC128996286 [Macrosteles quadrilineatus]|uniref:uncharacterized protein LOC128996286 n=1 Tax=Macrosteles quadrilineatus TaxID=74068 RepID=UPI0023E28B14|nr:uncharacterized protein LOC128996286 [Macrosteles quadrilineatus]
MSGVTSDYPEHLNPFDESYDPACASPVAPPRTSGRHKYNTWNAREQQAVKPKATFLEKPWSALNISPKGKLVRRLSVLKTAVEKFATKKKKRLEHSSSYREASLQPRSNSLHEDFNYRIISPKLKEKIRQQVFSRSISTQEQETKSADEDSQSPQLNGRLTLPLNLDVENQTKADDHSPTSPESETDVSVLGARPKARKKRPPPPPPVETSRPDATNGLERSDDGHSANSSITHDLEKDALTDDDISFVELDKLNKSDKHF